MNITFNKFGWILPLLWYPAKLASDFIIDKSEWLRYEIEHSLAFELIIMSIFLLLIEKLSPKKISKTISNETELFSEDKNILLKLDFLWWTIVLNVVSATIGAYKLLKYIEDNYTKAEFGMLIIFLSAVILIFATRKKLLSYRKSKNIEIIQDELKRVYENNKIKTANRYNKNEIVMRITSIISFISMALILLQGLIGISYFTLAMLLYYTRLKAVENDKLLEYALMYRQGAAALLILFTIIPIIILIIVFAKNKRVVINFKREILLKIKDKIYKYAAINFVLLTVSLFIFRYFFIHRELAALYYFLYPIICFAIYYWRYKLYLKINACKLE